MSVTAQWIAAGGAVGGAVATTIAVVLAYLGLRGELRRGNEQRALDAAQRERDRLDRQDREAAQARLVLITVDHAAAGWEGSGPRGQLTVNGEITVHLNNHSQLPVLAAHLEHVVLRIPREQPDAGEVAEPAQSWEPASDISHLHGPVAPGDSRSWPVLIFVPTGPGAARQRVVGATDAYEATATFTDATGLSWRRRSGAGQPERVWADPDTT